MSWLLANKEWFFSGIGVIAVPPLLFAIQSVVGALSRHLQLGVAGPWSISIDSAHHKGPHGKMILSQIGPFVWGSAELSITETGRDDRILHYRYRGRYQKEQAVMIFREVGKDARVVGTTFLKLATRAESAVGLNAFWDHTTNERRTQAFTLRRLVAV